MSQACQNPCGGSAEMGKKLCRRSFHYHHMIISSVYTKMCLRLLHIPPSNPLLSAQLSTPLNPPPFFGVVGHGPLVPQAVLGRNKVKLKLNYEGPDPQLFAISIITCFRRVEGSGISKSSYLYALTSANFSHP